MWLWSDCRIRSAVWNNMMWHIGLMCSSKRWPCFLKSSLGPHPLRLHLSATVAFPTALSLPLSFTPGEDAGEPLSHPFHLTPAEEDLQGGPLKKLNRLEAPLLDAHLVWDETQLLVMCKWAWSCQTDAGASGWLSRADLHSARIKTQFVTCQIK